MYTRTCMMSAVRRVKTVLVDLSGTIHIDDMEIPGAVASLERLRKTGVNLKFVTNTTKESGRFLRNRLNRIGFSIAEGEIFSSLSAARKLVETRNYRPLLLLDPRAYEEFEGVRQDTPNSVVIGLAPDKFHYEQLNQAFRLLLDKVPLIAIHKAKYYKRADGLALGPGPFIEGLEYAADVKAEVVGKPEKVFFTSAVEEFNCGVEDCIMIGDDVFGDVAGAHEAGMLGILVKTGKYREKDECKISPPPHMVVEDFPGAVSYIIDNLL